MKLNVGIAQTPNSTDLEKNFASISHLLMRFEKSGADLVLFPECSLSGFSAKMKECTRTSLQPYLDKIQLWTNRTGIEVVLPTAIVDAGQVFNTGFWFKRGESCAFFKTGLTDSEKKFFSVPADGQPKIFHTKGFSLVVLICFEAEHAPWSYFPEGEVDAILWPGYWGWTPAEEWKTERGEGKPNPIFSNMTQWKMPLLQSNFAFNALEGHKGAGPEGLSFIVGHDNQLVHRGPHRQADGFVVCLEKQERQTRVSGCVSL